MQLPKHLQDKLKTARIYACLINLLKYANEGTDFIAKIVACNEVWCHHFDPASKRMSMALWRPSSLRPKKSHSAPKAEKVIPSFIFDDEGPLFMEWLQQGVTVNAEVYYKRW